MCRIPLKTYLLLAMLTLGTMGFSNSSLGHLNYPTQVIFKCCKLIPVLVGGILIQQKRYGILDFIAAGCMCLGLTLFTLADSYVSPNFSTIGLSSRFCFLYSLTTAYLAFNFRIFLTNYVVLKYRPTNQLHCSYKCCSFQ
jgi:hypothetical protein